LVGLEYGDLFEEWETVLARKLVSQFQAKYPWLRYPERDDLLQECFSHWCLKRDKFTPSKGASISTYMSIVIRNRLDNILEEQLAEKRKLGHFAISLDETTTDAETCLKDILPDNRTSVADDASLRADVERLMGKLSPLQKTICLLLSRGHSGREIANVLGKSKSSIYEEIKGLGNIFANEGIDEYLT